MKDRDEYIAELKAFFGKGNLNTWVQEAGRYNFAGATGMLEDSEFDALEEKYPKFLAAAATFGAPRADFRIADSALEIDRLRDSFKDAFNNLVRGWEHLSSLASDEAGFTDNNNYKKDVVLLKRCERLAAACAAGGIDVPANIHEFELKEPLTEEQAAEMRKFFSAEKLEDVLEKSDEALAAEAEAAELTKVAEAALAIWNNIEPSLEAFEEVAEMDVSEFEDSNALREFYLPHLEKLHAFRDNEFGQVQDFLAFVEKEHEDCGMLTHKMSTHRVGTQEQRDAIEYLRKSVERFTDSCLQVARNFEHEAFLNISISEHQYADKVERRIALYQRVEDLGHLALAFNPESENGKKYATEMAEKIAKEQADHAAAIANAKWNDHYKKFKGPGEAVELAKTALKYAQDNFYAEDGTRYFAASVAKDWFVGKRDWLGQPTQYRIPCWIAQTVPNQQGIARITKMDFIAHFVKTEPPFGAVSSMTWTAYRIPIEKVEKSATVLDKDALKEGKKLAQRH